VSGVQVRVREHERVVLSFKVVCAAAASAQCASDGACLSPYPFAGTSVAGVPVGLGAAVNGH
jgi:hypothetical protein